MREVQIVSDAIIDFGEEYFIKNNIIPIHHGIIVDGKEIFDGFYKEMTAKMLHDKLRSGINISTVQGNIEQMYDAFNKAKSEGKDVLYICFSSALSGTFNTAKIVANDVLTEDMKIEIFDSKSAASGQGLLVNKAVEFAKMGLTVSEITDKLEKLKNKICHYAVIDDLEHLKRGGRISKTAAVVGGIIGIKPIIKVTSEGKLEPYTKVRSMSKALEEIKNKVDENYGSGDIFIAHCDNVKLAETLKEMLDYKNVYINQLSNTIACHIGPNGVGAFFIGK